MTRIIVLEKSKILNSAELERIAKSLAKINSNLLIFGLPNSGKSLLVKAVCKKSTRFITLKEEEILDEKNGEALKQAIGNKKWVAGHQFPTMDENTPDQRLIDFVIEKMGLNPKEWTIIRIKTK